MQATPTMKCEIELVTDSGVWEDVTAFVDSGFRITRSRTSPYSPVGPATLALTFDNSDGRFTPKRQVLNDGVTAHPYYPNIRPRKRIRLSYEVAGGWETSLAWDFDTPTPFTAVGAGSVTQDATAAHDGTNSLKLTLGTGGAGTQGASAGFTLAPFSEGWRYQISVWLRGETGQSRPKLIVDDGAGGNLVSAIGTANGTWTQVTVTYTVPVSHAIRLQVVNADAATAGWLMRADTLVMKKLTAVRFLGRIPEWPPTKENGRGRLVMPINAVDDLVRMSGITLKSAIAEEVTYSKPTHWWPVADPTGAAYVLGTPILYLRRYGFLGALTFAQPGPAGGELAALFAPQSLTEGLYLRSSADVMPVTSTTPFSVECWVKLTANPGGTVTVWNYSDGVWAGNYMALSISSSGAARFTLGGTTITGNTLSLNTWQNIICTFDGATGPGLWVDGVGSTGVAAPAGTLKLFTAAGDPGSNVVNGLLSGSLAGLAIYPTDVSADVLNHVAAGADFVGETTGERVARYLRYASLQTDAKVDFGVPLLGSFQQAGKSVVDASQQASVDEGGGSVFYVRPDGRARFTGRGFRAGNLTPAVTFDAVLDLLGNDWQPTYDVSQIANDVTGSRGTYSGVQAVQHVLDQASIDEFQRATDPFTSYAQDDADVLYNAQDRLSRRKDAGFRLPRATVDLSTASADFFATLPQLEVGSRIRIGNVVPGALHRSQVDGYIEGWTEEMAAGGAPYVVSFDLSPAGANGLTGGSSERAIFDDARFGCDGQTITITNSSTTAVIATAGGKATFTTDPTCYPLTIQVEEEEITLNSAPSGSTTPQTFTAVTRGANGSLKAAHTAAVVELAPAHTFAL